jgi:hypothetical protein
MKRMVPMALAGLRIIRPILVEDRDGNLRLNASLERHHVYGPSLS